MKMCEQIPKIITSLKFALLLTYLILVLTLLVDAQTNGQVSTPCTTSMISTFTPCMNYITGSTAGGDSSPSSGCCEALKRVMKSSMNCACLMITGGVPLPQIVNSTLVLGIFRVCTRNAGLPLQCTASGVPLPPPGPVRFGAPPLAESAFSPQASETPSAAPGPVQFGATPSPSSNISPQASKATTFTPPEAEEQPPTEAPSSVDVKPPSQTPKVRPVLVRPSSSAASNVFPHSIPPNTYIWAYLILFKLFNY